MDPKSKQVKKRVLHARNAVRRKTRLLRANRAVVKNIVETKARPLMEPLQDIAKSLVDKTLVFDGTGGIGPTMVADAPAVARPIPTTLTWEGEGTLPSSTPRRSLQRQQSEVLRNYVSTPEGRTEMETSLNEVSMHGRPFIRYLLTGEIPEGEQNDMDTVYGPRVGPAGKLLLGDSEMSLDNENIYIRDRSFPATEGLFNLIFLSTPTNFTSDDLNNYGDIVRSTNVARRGYSASREFNTSGKKYRQLLRKLVRDPQTGVGFKVTPPPTTSFQYVYWDNINELVDRLRLLFASSQAGNNSHRNEIDSIIEELEERCVIAVA